MNMKKLKEINLRYEKHFICFGIDYEGFIYARTNHTNIIKLKLGTLIKTIEGDIITTEQFINKINLK